MLVSELVKQNQRRKEYSNFLNCYPRVVTIIKSYEHLSSFLPFFTTKQRAMSNTLKVLSIMLRGLETKTLRSPRLIGHKPVYNARSEQVLS